MAKHLSDDEVIKYVTETLHMPKEVCLCKDCGGVVKWKDVHLSFMTRPPRTGVYGKWNKLKAYNKKQSDGVSFMTERTYNGNTYHLQYCYDCACKRYPEILSQKFPLNPATRRSQFLFDISDEDFSSITESVCKRTKENYIKTFGEEEGLKRWNSYCQKQAETNTFEYKKKKYGWTKQEFREYNRSRAVTKENLITKHGEEEGMRIFEDYREKQRYSCSLEYFKEMYGDEDGEKKYNEWQFSKCGKFVSVSPIANDLCSRLSKYFEGHKIYCDESEYGEKRIGSYSLDYYDETLNVVVEFYGDLWHANPKKFITETDRTDVLIEKIGKTASELWERDTKRQKFVENELNTKMFIVWELDYRYNREDVVLELVNEINAYVASRDGSLPTDTTKTLSIPKTNPLF